MDILKEILTICGFTDIKKYDAFDFLGDKDDYSKCYQPHMDFENGELMSLNIICKKEKDIRIDNIKYSDKIKKFIKYNQFKHNILFNTYIMKYVTYNHTSHAMYSKNICNGSVFQEILSCFIISIICDLKVVYHDSWKHCGFITYNSFKNNTTKLLEKYYNIINIDNYLKLESISFDDLMDIKTFISECSDNTLIILGNVCLINPSFLYKWYKNGLLDKDYYTELFLPKIRELYFYDHDNTQIDQFYIHIRNGDIGKRYYDEGLTLEYYTNIIKLINSVSDIKINIMYEGDTKNSNVYLSPCYVELRKKTNYNHLWCRELGKLPNVILNEGDLDNLDKHINELCSAKYLLSSPSHFSYYSSIISNGLKFVDDRVLNMHPDALGNTKDLPQFIFYDNFEDVLKYLSI